MNANLQPRDAILLESGTNEVEFIEFYLGDTSFGINVSKVQRVLARSSVEVNKVAQAPASTLGMIHIRETPVMLMDLKSALNISFDPESINPSRQLILVTAFNQQTTAFLIDGISKIHRTSWENFKPMSHTIGGDEGGFSTGTVTLNDNIIIILDIERLMLRLFPETHSHMLEDIKVEDRKGREAIRIVYAEDSHMVRSITENIIKGAGYEQILSFDNGRDAYDYLEQTAEEAKARGGSLADEVDLVLTDIEMPKMDGLTLCRRVKRELCSINPPKVVVYSSLINREMIVKCESVGADAQLAKPEVETIVNLLDELCLAPES